MIDLTHNGKLIQCLYIRCICIHNTIQYLNSTFKSNPWAEAGVRMKLRSVVHPCVVRRENILCNIVKFIKFVSVMKMVLKTTVTHFPPWCIVARMLARFVTRAAKLFPPPQPLFHVRNLFSTYDKMW